MANDLTGNPLVCDSTGTLIADEVPFTLLGFWYIGTTDLDDLIVQDADGTNVWSAKLGDVSVIGYNTGIIFGNSGLSSNNGLVLNTIDHGTLYVYLSEPL